METKKKPNWFIKILLVLFLIYISLTIAMETGYYEAKLSERTIITEEGMKKFENDVNNGLDVDILDYTENLHEDYSNQTTKAGVKISSAIEKFMTKGISNLIEVLKTLFT